MTHVPWMAVFDMDGTLLPGTTACQQIARAAGDTATIDLLEKSYSAGSITSSQFAHRALRSWKRHGEELFARAFAAAPKLRDIDKALSYVADTGGVSVLMSMAPKQFVDLFTDFDFVFSSDYAGRILEPSDKPVFAEHLRVQLGVDRNRVLALGDSHSDVPLFAAVEHTVAVNADEQIKGLATSVYGGDSAFEALMVGIESMGPSRVG